MKSRSFNSTDKLKRQTYENPNTKYTKPDARFPFLSDAKHITATSNTELAPPFHLVIPTPLIAKFPPLYKGKSLALYRIE